MMLAGLRVGRMLYGFLLLSALASIHVWLQLPPAITLAEDPLVRHLDGLKAVAPAPDLRRDGADVPETHSLFAIEEPPAPVVQQPAPVTPPVPPAPPSAPQAPPVPFQYMGRMDDESVRVFLRRGEDIFVAAVGENLDSFYRLDSVDEKRVGLTYLPLNQPQFVPVR